MVLKMMIRSSFYIRIIAYEHEEVFSVTQTLSFLLLSVVVSACIVKKKKWLPAHDALSQGCQDIINKI